MNSSFVIHANFPQAKVHAISKHISNEDSAARAGDKHSLGRSLARTRRPAQVVPIPDVRRSTRRVVQVGDRALAIHIARVRERTVLSVVETTAEASGGSTLQVELKLSRLGISIMQEHPHASCLFESGCQTCVRLGVILSVEGRMEG